MENFLGGGGEGLSGFLAPAPRPGGPYPGCGSLSGGPLPCGGPLGPLVGDEKFCRLSGLRPGLPARNGGAFLDGSLQC